MCPGGDCEAKALWDHGATEHGTLGAGRRLLIQRLHGGFSAEMPTFLL